MANVSYEAVCQRCVAAPIANTRPEISSMPPVCIMQVPSAASQLTKVLVGLRHTFVVADATLPDCPLIYASEG